MKGIKATLCWLLLAGLLVSSYIVYKSGAVTQQSVVSRSNESWSGVLRIWTYTGWQSGGGSLTPWLNECATQFEKKHKGVRIQIQSVSEKTLRNFADGEINPPDALLFAPGLLTDTAHLLPLESPSSLLPSLCETGGGYAVPVAMGGYAWAYNKALLSSIPADWSQLERPTVKKKRIYLMQVNRDQPYICWSQALLSLCSGITYIKEETLAGEGVDFGLPVPTEEPGKPSATPVAIPCRLPADLPDDFRQTDEAYTEFINGTVAAIPVTQRELRRLQVLSENGRGPDYAVETSGTPFTDQLALFSIVDIDRSNLADRQQLCYEYLSLLLSDDAQQSLTGVRAFRTTPGALLYGAQRSMLAIEKALVSDDLTVPDAFDGAWREQSASDASQMAAASSPAK